MLHQNNGTNIDEKTLQYILLLFFKISLNTLILSIWKQNITKSLLGVFSIFLYLSDLLLLGSILWVWWFRQNTSAYDGICLCLSFSSTVYSMLPPLAFFGGAVDYALGQQEGWVKKYLARTSMHFLVVMVIWAMACVYSYYYTNSELLIIKCQEGLDALVCPVQASEFIRQFMSKLFIVVFVILMFNFRDLPHWFQMIKNPPWYLSTCSQTYTSDLAFTWKQDRLEEGLEVGTKQHYSNDQHDLPPLFIMMIICFALSWTPYMLVSMICNILVFAVPSYASVNLLWTACANSFLAGLTFWYKSKKYGPAYNVPDKFCLWSAYWHLSKESSNQPLIKLHNDQVY